MRCSRRAATTARSVPAMAWPTFTSIVRHRRLDEAIRTALDDVRAAGFDVDRVESDEFATICHFNRELAEA